MFGGGALGGFSNQINALQISGCAYGKSIRTIFGQTLSTADLIWANNFKRFTSKFGFLGAPPSYTVGADFLLCEAPLLNLLTFWIQGGKFFTPQRYGYYIGTYDTTIQHVTSSDYDFAPPPALGINTLICYLGAQMLDVTYTQTFDDYGSAGPQTVSGTSLLSMYPQPTLVAPLYDFVSAPTERTGYPYPYVWYDDGQLAISNSSPIRFQPGSTPPIGGDGFSTVLIGRPVRVWYAFASPLSWTADPRPLQGITFTQMEQELGSGTEFGDNNQSAQQIIYQDVAGFGYSSLDVGSGANIPNIAVEARSNYAFNYNGDALPSDMIAALVLAGPGSFYGANVGAIYNQMFSQTNAPLTSFFEPTSFANYQAFCMAYQMYLSGNLQEQRKCSEYVRDILDVTQCAAVWSGFQWKLIPRCEVSAITDNNQPYISPTASGPIYTLGYNSLVKASKSVPLVTSRTRQSDAYNIVRVEHLERANDYTTDVTTALNQGSIQNYGPRPAPTKSLHFIQDSLTAMKTATMMVQRASALRKIYKFRIPIRYSLAEPMDVVLIPRNPPVDMTLIPVRLTSMKEIKKGGWDCEAEDFIYGVSQPSPQAVAVTTPNATYGSNDPGNVNAPIIFVAADGLVGGVSSPPYFGFAVSGADLTDWGGCNVWMSALGGAYQQIGVIVGAAIQGVSMNDFPSHADPDTADTLNVDFTESGGVLASVTDAERDAFLTATYVQSAAGYELISWANVAQITGNQYAIQPTTRRGVYGTTIADHPIGSAVAVLVSNILYAPYNPALNSTTVNFKFASFNLTGDIVQDIALLPAYSFVP